MNIFKTYTNFFKKRIFLLFLCLFHIVICAILPQLLIVLCPLSLLYFYFTNQQSTALLFFIFVLIASDSYESFLQIFKTLRIECIVILFLLAIRQIWREQKFSVNILHILPLIGCFFISLIFSPTLFQTALRTLSYLFLPVIVFTLYKKIIIATGGRFLVDIITFSSIFILLGYILLFVSPSLTSIVSTPASGFRFGGIFGNPNGQSIYCFLLLPLILYVRQLRLIDRTTYFYFLGLILFSILISGSRTALAGSLLILVYWVINNFSRIYRILFKLTIPIGVVGLMLFGGILLQQSSFLSQRLRVETISSAGGRLAAWQWGYQQVPKHLYFGRGLMYDSYAYKANFSEAFRRGNRGFNAAFSGVLAFLLNAGVIGVLAFLFFIYKSYSKFKYSKIVIPLFIAMLISWTFESWIVATLNAFTILFFIQIVAFQVLPLKNYSDGSLIKNNSI